MLLPRPTIPLQCSLDFSVHIEWCFEFLCVQKLLNLNLGAVLLRLSNFEEKRLTCVGTGHLNPTSYQAEESFRKEDFLLQYS